MPGCRPLTDAEVLVVSQSFGGHYAARDKALFLLGTWTGFRISELLSLRVRDIWQYGQIVDVVTVAKRHMKGKPQSRRMAVRAEAQAALRQWIEAMPATWDPMSYVFRSRKGGNRPIQRGHAWQILHDAYVANELQGPLGTHTMRKTFAMRLYRRDHDLALVQRALGHASIASTGKYLESVTADEVFAAVRSL